MFKFGNDYEKKSIIVLKKVLCVVLTLSLIVTVFTISVTAGEYNDVNKSKYHLANWYGLDELPFGDDSGVLYLHTYTDRNIDLTLVYDKCTPLSQFNGNVFVDDFDTNSISKNFVLSHLFSIRANTSTKHLVVSFISDNPVFYTYGNTGEDWKTLPWTSISQRITLVGPKHGDSQSDTSYTRVYRPCYVYLDVDLSLYGFDITSKNALKVYSNKIAIQDIASDFTKDSLELSTINLQRPLDSQHGAYYIPFVSRYVSYMFACYPTSECLRDWQLFANENRNFQELFDKLSELDNLGFNLGTLLELQFEQNDMLGQMNDTLNQIMHPEDYPADGLLKDKSMSDKLDGVIGNVKIDSSASQYITSLSASFIVIRGIWDKIVNFFGFAPVIGLLLFLAFVAYLLGRALKGRSE